MRMKSSPARLRGTVKIPGSKSHTIRGVLLASSAEGTKMGREKRRGLEHVRARLEAQEDLEALSRPPLLIPSVLLTPDRSVDADEASLKLGGRSRAQKMQ